MKPSLKRGFSAVKEAQQEIEVRKQQAEQRREQAKERIHDFYPRDGEEVKMYFLTVDPMEYMGHTVQVESKGRKPYYKTMFCKGTIGEECEYCQDAESQRSRTYYGWLVWNPTPFEVKERDANGKETGRTRTVNGSVQRLERGVTDSAIITRNHTRYAGKDENGEVKLDARGNVLESGLTNRPYMVSKNPGGKGWLFDRGDEGYLSKTDLENIRKTLPEKIRDLDFYEILERQIIPPTVGGGVSREEARKVASQGMEEMEEDEPQEEAEEKPKKVLMRKK